MQLLGAIRTVTKANIIGADVNELAPMPVSYTHLDVYKRQILSADMASEVRQLLGQKRR